MTLPRTTYCLLLVAVLLASCNKAPDGVISEGTMTQLIIDLNKAEYYVQSHSNEFPDDSTRMALKQSIFAKHGVDQELYDHSLEWYGMNMDVYIEVCDRAFKQLEDEKKSLAKRMEQEPMPSRTDGPMRMGMPTYASRGDTADVWTGRRSWMLTAGMQHGALRWEQQPDEEHQPGDKYMLRVKVQSNSHGMTATMLADYSDGTTSSITHPLSTNNWNVMTLQTDSTRQLRRVYGYLNYKMQPQTVAMIDSVSLVRTHLDRASYGLIGSQITVHRNGEQEPAKAKPALPDAHQQRDLADEQERAAFHPRPEVNRSKHPRHIEQGLNSKHQPK
jgi:hypothetical protein